MKEWLEGQLGERLSLTNTPPSSSGQAVTVNGVSVKFPKVYTGPGLSLHHAGLFLLLTTRLGLTLLWDGGWVAPSPLAHTGPAFALVAAVP